MFYTIFKPILPNYPLFTLDISVNIIYTVYRTLKKGENKMKICKNQSHKHIMAKPIKVYKYGKLIKIINQCKQNGK